MWTRQHKNRHTGVLIVPTIAAVVLTYFGFHAWHGEFGIYSSYELVERKAALEVKLAELKAERAHLESRVLLLRDGTIEKDMLEEQARRALNLTRPNEVTIMRPAPNAVN